MIMFNRTLFSVNDVQSIQESTNTAGEYQIAVTLKNGNVIKNTTVSEELKNHWLKLLRGEYQNVESH